jgi:HTH-type transcriptional regulator, quorum sensing regulator NprR
LRLQAGLSQNALAQGLVTKSMISQIESDKARPSRQLLASLAERLGVTLEHLLPAQHIDQERLARYKQAQAFFTLGHFEQALHELEACLASPHPHWPLVEVICQAAHCLHKLGRLESAQAKYEEALRLAIRENRSAQAVMIRFQLGKVADDSGHTQVALREWTRTYQEWKSLASVEVQEQVPLEDLCLQLGTLYEELNAHEEAIRFYREARRAMQGKRVTSRKRAVMERGLGAMLLKESRWRDAEEHLQKAEDLYRLLRDVRGQYEVVVLRVALLRHSGRSKEARSLLEASLAEVEARNLPKQQSRLLYELGQFLREIGEREKALERLQQAALLLPQEGPIRGGIELEIAELQCEDGQWEDALQGAERARAELSKTTQHDEELLRVYRLLTHVFKQLGDYEQASLALVETNRLLDKQIRDKGWMLGNAAQGL